MWSFLRNNNPAAEELPGAAAAPAAVSSPAAAESITAKYARLGQLTLEEWKTPEGFAIIRAHEAGRGIGEEQVQYMRQTARVNPKLQPPPAAKPAPYKPTFSEVMKKARTSRSKISSLNDQDFEVLAEHLDKIESHVLRHRVAEFTGNRRAAELGRRYTHVYEPDAPAAEPSAEERELQTIMGDLRAKTRLVTASDGSKALMRALPNGGYVAIQAGATPTPAELRIEAAAVRFMREAAARAKDPKAARAADDARFRKQLAQADPEHQQKCDHVREVLKGLQAGKSRAPQPWVFGAGGGQ
jgi:hypothetical protein